MVYLYSLVDVHKAIWQPLVRKDCRIKVTGKVWPNLAHQIGLLLKNEVELVAEDDLDQEYEN